MTSPSSEEGQRNSRLVGGALLLLVGSLLVAKNFGYVHAGRIVDYWPLLLVWVGATRILAPKRGRHVVSGAILVGLGALLLADRFDWMDLSMRDFWPIACVIAGFAMIAEGLFARKRDAGGAIGGQS